MQVLKRTKAFEVRLYMGSRKGYGEEQYASHHVVRAIISKDYLEEGWEIAVVRYPLREDSDDDIIQWAGELAAVLMKRFQQEQMSAVIRDELIVFSRE